MSEHVKPVHRQLLELGDQALDIPEARASLYPCWESRADWHPGLMIYPTKWYRTDASNRVRLERARFTVFDGLNSAKLTADSKVGRDYLNNEFGRYFLDQFQHFFADEAAVSMSGLIRMVAPGPDAVMDNAFKVEFSALREDLLLQSSHD